MTKFIQSPIGAIRSQVFFVIINSAGIKECFVFVLSRLLFVVFLLVVDVIDNFGYY